MPYQQATLMNGVGLKGSFWSSLLHLSLSGSLEACWECKCEGSCPSHTHTHTVIQHGGCQVWVNAVGCTCTAQGLPQNALQWQQGTLGL